MKLWAKVILDNKIIKDFTYENDQDFNINHLCLYMTDICEALDMETPVILKKHHEQLYLFRITTFHLCDFMHESGFDKLTIENIT